MSISPAPPGNDVTPPEATDTPRPIGRSLRLVMQTVAPGVRCIRAEGILDQEGGARLLRLVDSQLVLDAVGERGLMGLIIDVGAVDDAQRGGPEALRHIRFTCARRHIEVVLAGGHGRLSSAALSARRHLGHFRHYPDAGVALRALTGPAAER